VKLQRQPDLVTSVSPPVTRSKFTYTNGDEPQYLAWGGSGFQHEKHPFGKSGQDCGGIGILADGRTIPPRRSTVYFADRHVEFLVRRHGRRSLHRGTCSPIPPGNICYGPWLGNGRA